MIPSRFLSCILLVVAAAIETRPLFAFGGYWPVDDLGEEDRNISIEWKENWQATYETHRQRWQKEIESAVRDTGAREARLRLRLLRLLEAALERTPAGSEDRHGLYLAIADHLYQLGFRGRCNYYLKRVVEEFPGRPDFAVSALTQILQRTPWDHPEQAEEGPEWVEYASDRILALERAGILSGYQPGVLLAWKSAVVLRRQQGRLFEASKALEKVKARLPGDIWWGPQEAELLYLAGRSERSLQRFQDIAAILPHDHPDNSWVQHRIYHLSVGSLFHFQPTFSTGTGLQGPWETVLSTPARAASARLHGLMRENAEGNRVVASGPSLYSSLWSILDRHILSQPTAEILPLRELQELQAREDLEEENHGQSPDGWFSFYRRYPWSSSSHEGLIGWGEDALRKGHFGLALRMFQDADSHALEPGLRGRACVGLCLALVQGPRPRELLEEWRARAPADAPLALAGESVTVAILQERLTGGIASRPTGDLPCPSLSDMKRQLLDVPNIPPYPVEIFDFSAQEFVESYPGLPGTLQAFEGGFLFSGLDLLVWFGEDSAKPRWVRSSPLSRGLQGRLDREIHSRFIAVPGPLHPRLAGDKIFARWSMDPARRILADLAAFDVQTGDLVWSTARDPAWEGAWPVSDPAVSDGRVYVMAAPGEKGFYSPIFLFCLDAENGRMLWKRLLAFVPHLTIPLGWDSGFYGHRVSLIHYGNAVTVDGGAVYCLTNAGVIARADARDGLIEWVRTYPRDISPSNLWRLFSRLSSAPILHRGNLVITARDCPGTFALNADTGDLLWDQPFVPSKEVVGLAGDTLILHEDGHLAAMDLNKGQVVWNRFFPKGVLGKPALAGAFLYVATSQKLLKLSAETGVELEESPWSEKGPLHPFCVRQGMLAGVRSETTAGGAPREDGEFVPRASPEPPSSGLRPPFRHAGRLLRPNPRLWVAPPTPEVTDRMILLSEGILECISTRPPAGVEWRIKPAKGLVDLAWAGPMLLLIYPGRLAALDAASAAARWEWESPFRIGKWDVVGPYLVLGDLLGGRAGGHKAVIDLASGKLLWSRALGDDAHKSSLPFTLFDGRFLTFFGFAEREHSEVALTVDASSGQATRLRKELPAAAPTLGGDGFELETARPEPLIIHRFLFDENVLPETYPELPGLSLSNIQEFAVTGPWMQFRQDRPKAPPIFWTLRREDPEYHLQRPIPGKIFGDRLYELSGRGVTGWDLPSREVANHYKISTAGKAQILEIIDSWEDQRLVFLVSAVNRGSFHSTELRLDFFDRETGNLRGTHFFPEVPYWQVVGVGEKVWRKTQVVRGQGSLFFTEAHGLHVFVPAAPGESAAEPQISLVPLSSRPIRVDADLGEWEPKDSLVLEGQGGQIGKLFLGQDATHFYWGFGFPDAEARPKRGRAHGGDGDWLELGITTNSGSFRWGVGMDERGRVAWENLVSSPMPEKMEARARHNAVSGHWVYELSIPLDAILDRGQPNWRRMGVSLIVWDHNEVGGQRRLFAWGDALRGRQVIPEAHARIELAR